MTPLLENAASILQTAERAMRAGHSPTDLTILIGVEGGVRMIADADACLHALQAQHGASAAYRVSTHRGTVRVDARGNGQTCRLESEPPARIARMLLGTSSLAQFQALKETVAEPEHRPLLLISA